MGIKGLKKVISDNCPKSITEIKTKNLFNRKIAIDASICIYRFLVSVRIDGNNLSSIHGEQTSHIVGFFYKTIRLLELGIKPVFVFDGEAPVLKNEELLKRNERRDKAEEKYQIAKEQEDTNEMLRQSKRSVRMTEKHINDIKKLLFLMGVPFIVAPSEAEAQCAEMCKLNLVYGVASEDMDTLAFSAPIMIKNLTFSEAKKIPVCEIRHSLILKEISLTENQFIDLCILLGCDYCKTIKGVGPMKALQLIRKHESIEKILECLEEKYEVPEGWGYENAREFLKKPNVISDYSVLNENLKWKTPEKEKLKEYLTKECDFAEERFEKAYKRIILSKKTEQQKRICDFFKNIKEST